MKVNVIVEVNFEITSFLLFLFLKMLLLHWQDLVNMALHLKKVQHQLKTNLYQNVCLGPQRIDAFVTQSCSLYYLCWHSYLPLFMLKLVTTFGVLQHLVLNFKELLNPTPIVMIFIHHRTAVVSWRKKER